MDSLSESASADAAAALVEQNAVRATRQAQPASQLLDLVVSVFDALREGRYHNLPFDQRASFEGRLVDELWGGEPIVPRAMARFMRRRMRHAHLATAAKALERERPDLVTDLGRYEEIAAYVRRMYSGTGADPRTDWEHEIRAASVWGKLPASWQRIRAVCRGDF